MTLSFVRNCKNVARSGLTIARVIVHFYILCVFFTLKNVDLFLNGMNPVRTTCILIVRMAFLGNLRINRFYTSFSSTLVFENLLFFIYSFEGIEKKTDIQSAPVCYDAAV